MIGRVNRCRELLRADQMARMPFVIHESGNPHDTSAIGSGRIGPELSDQPAHRQLGLFLAETLNLPRNLPMVRRRVDQVIRFSDVFANLEMLDGLCPVFIEV